MKTPLHYQMTEYDCGPISMMNAIIFLFDREQIPPDLIRNIMLYCLDGYGAEGAPGRSGTTRAAMMFLSNFLGSFGRTGQLDLSARYLSGSCVRVSQNSAITDCLRRGGAVVVRLYLLDDPHYILLTGVQGEKLCAFDPYLPEEPLPEKDIVMTDLAVAVLVDLLGVGSVQVSEDLALHDAGLFGLGADEDGVGTGHDRGVNGLLVVEGDGNIVLLGKVDQILASGGVAEVDDDVILAGGEHNVSLVVLGSLVVVAVLHLEVDGQALLSADLLGVLVHGNTDGGAVGVGVLPDENADVQLGLALGSGLGSGLFNGFSGFGRFRGGLGSSRGLGRGFSLFGSAGYHGQNHHHCKQHSDDLFHV